MSWIQAGILSLNGLVTHDAQTRTNIFWNAPG
jgi:torulene dioxygenase